LHEIADILFLIFKELSLNLQKKTISAAEVKICGLLMSIGRLLQRTDSGNPINIRG
jgi:hypothetical protein